MFNLLYVLLPLVWAIEYILFVSSTYVRFNGFGIIEKLPEYAKHTDLASS